MTNKVIIVHSLDHAKAALASAKELGLSVTLRSAPNAAAFMGAEVFREMMDQAMAAHPSVTATAILDCGADAGRALNALRNGVKEISLKASEDVMEKIADIAKQQDATLDTSAEKALNLATVDDPTAACRTWLRET
jgi:fructose/tagatose bisphosphate aldolase